jgi:hypothetical protein
MKEIFLTAINLLISLQAFTQNIFGMYSDKFGIKLELLSDYNYFYSYHIDLSSSWSIGKWATSNDTVFLRNSPIYDTVNVTDTVWVFQKNTK